MTLAPLPVLPKATVVGKRGHAVVTYRKNGGGVEFMVHLNVANGISAIYFNRVNNSLTVKLSHHDAPSELTLIPGGSEAMCVEVMAKLLDVAAGLSVNWTSGVLKTDAVKKTVRKLRAASAK